MKNSNPEKSGIDNQQIKQVKVEFTGNNITNFGGGELIRKFFKRHRVKQRMDSRIQVEGRRKSKYGTGSSFSDCK